jgi:hypothetical protein
MRWDDCGTFSILLVVSGSFSCYGDVITAYPPNVSNGKLYSFSLSAAYVEEEVAMQDRGYLRSDFFL